ncbi:YlcI/YnfO family protein [Escherichia coli]
MTCWLRVLSLQHQSHGFPNPMIEQINIALDQKGSGNFSAWVIEACRRRLCSEKRVSPEANKEKSDITELLRK